MIESRKSSPADAPRSARGAHILALIAALTTFACGISESVTNPCQVEDRGFQSAANLRDGLIQRNLDRQSPIYKASVERVRIAEEGLLRCQDEESARS
jgi:hypothetical protein